MSCPHSTRPDTTPLTCSQCLAYDARKVTIDAQGILKVDSVVLGRLSDVNRQKYADETAAVGPPNKKRVCGNCGASGHNARTCGVKVPDDPGLN